MEVKHDDNHRNQSGRDVARMAIDPAFYRQQLRIEVSGEVVRYADVAADWQETDFVAMDPAWLRCVGRSKEHVPKMRSWLERCRGASKTFDLAVMAAWGLRFAQRKVRFNWFAGDEDQAKLGIAAMETAVTLNPWLGLEIQKKVVRNPVTGSTLEILSSDAATGYGQLADAVLVDEIANWPETPARKRFGTSSYPHSPRKQIVCAKRSRMPVALAAGFGRTARKIRGDAAWYFRNLRTIPSWITQEQIAEQGRLLPRSVYDRTCCNNWTSGTDNGLSPADVEACCVLDGPMTCRRHAYDSYIAACDLGWLHDRTGLVVLAINFERREIALAFAASWHPQDYGGEVPLDLVENEILAVHQLFSLDKVVFDPTQATGTLQKLSNAGVPCFRALLAPKNQDVMAKALLQAFNQRRAKLYRHSELIADLLSLEVVDRTIGLKLQAARSAGGHSDLAFTYAIANVVAQEVLSDYGNYEPCDEVLVA